MQAVQGKQKMAQEGTLLGKCRSHLQAAETILNNLLAEKAVRNEANTMRPYNTIMVHMDQAMSSASLLSQVHPDAQVRTDAETCEQEAQKLATDMSLNRPLYEALAAVDQKPLDADAKRMLTKTLQDFKRGGVDKNEATRQKITEIEKELVLITQEYSRNIRDDVRFIEVDSAQDLKGLPADYIASHKPGPNGKIHVTTDYPDYVPFMMYADSGQHRKALWGKFMARGYPKNEPVLSEMLKKRYELARLLGYKSYADFVVEDKMMKTAPRISEFIEKITHIAKPGADKEYAMLLHEKRRTEPHAKAVMSYERGYLEEKVKQRNYHFNSQDVRPYFEFERVQQGLLDLTSELFGIHYERVTNAHPWDKSVTVFDVYEGGKRLGRIFLDLHPRDGKYKHAAQFTVQSGLRNEQLPEGALVCNFSDPATSNGPALMDHDQVVTFFHEFGHLLHHVLGGQQNWIRFSGVSTEWDFVEAPSQFFEEWAWDVGVLQRFAKHYKTGEPIPADLVKRMRAADEFGKGLDARTQMFYSALSLNYYWKDPATFDPMQALKKMQAQYSYFPYVEGTHFQLNFGHLEGYSALYYTYMWSKVIEKDLLTPFKKAGMMNKDVARHYRDTVLRPGGSKDAEELVKDFLGRPYRFDAFKEWLEAGV